MIICGPAVGVFLNVLIYLPLTIWLWNAPFGPKFRVSESGAKPGASIRGFADIVEALREAAKNRTLISLTLLAGMGSLFVGNAYQAQLPDVATLLN